MVNMRFPILLALLVLLSTSCQKELNEPVIINSIEEEFVIKPWQKLDPLNSDYEIIVQSVQEQNCENSILDLLYSIEENNIVIQINGISTDGPCIEGSSIPQVEIPLDIPPGSYTLQINVGSTIQNTGTLELGEEMLSISLPEDSGLTVDQGDIYNIPGGICWGYLDEKIAGAADLEMAANLIFLEINPITTLYEGNYGHFTIGDLNSITIPDSPEDVIGMLLDLRKPNAWNRLKEILAEYETKYPDIKYEFTRWNGLQIWN